MFHSRQLNRMPTSRKAPSLTASRYYPARPKKRSPFSSSCPNYNLTSHCTVTGCRGGESIEKRNYTTGPARESNGKPVR